MERLRGPKHVDAEPRKGRLHVPRTGSLCRPCPTTNVNRLLPRRGGRHILGDEVRLQRCNVPKMNNGTNASNVHFGIDASFEDNRQTSKVSHCFTTETCMANANRIQRREPPTAPPREHNGGAHSKLLFRKYHQGTGTSAHSRPRERIIRVMGQTQKLRRLPPGTIENETDYMLSSLLLGGHDLQVGNRATVSMARGQSYDRLE